MSTLSLRKIKHDSASVDNITLNSSGHVTTAERLIVNGATTNTNSNWGYYINPKSGGGVGDFTVTRPDGNVSWLSIDNSGRVTMPYQPAFNVRKNNSQTLNSIGNDIKIEYNSVSTNIGNHYSVANDRFTAPVSGMYHFSAFFMFNSFPTDYQYAFIRLLRNGNDAMESEVMLPRPSGGSFATSIVAMDVYLSANDYVEVFARQVGGSSNMVIREAFGVFSGYLIG